MGEDLLLLYETLTFSGFNSSLQRQADPAAGVTSRWRCWHVSDNCHHSYGAAQDSTAGCGQDG